MRLTRNFTLDEALVSTDHPELVPDPGDVPVEVVINACRLAHVLQDLRDEVGRIGVGSWIRLPELNEAVGGAKDSRHELGLAVDFEPLDLTVAGVFESIARGNLPNGFDRLAWYPGRHLHGDLDPGAFNAKPRRELYVVGIEGVPGWTKVDPVDAVRYATSYRKSGILRRDEGVRWV